MKYSFAPTQLTDLAASVVDELTPAAKTKGLALKYVQPAAPPPLINLDGEKIRQVMMNLVDNAVKYTKKGSVTVSVHLETPRANPRLTKPSVVFSVQDTGGGVRLEDQPRLFQKFIRGQGSSLVHTEGTGLGLYVGRMMVEAHAGAIWVASKGEGFGSTFAFAIPVPPPPKDKAVEALEQMLG
jgi:signal transduction histidine kinase